MHENYELKKMKKNLKLYIQNRIGWIILFGNALKVNCNLALAKFLSCYLTTTTGIV